MLGERVWGARGWEAEMPTDETRPAYSREELRAHLLSLATREELRAHLFEHGTDVRGWDLPAMDRLHLEVHQTMGEGR